MTRRWVPVIAACLSCLGCRAGNPARSPDAASSGPPDTVVRAESAAGTSVVYAYYFHRTFRCMSCQTMEDLAARTIEERFAQQTKKGQVVWMTVNIDEPAGKAFGQQFDAQGSDLVVARMENGVCKNSKRLDELWGLKDRPEAFSQYLASEIDALLGPAQSR